MNFTPNQLRAARGSLDISQADLHRETGVAQSSISEFEKEKSDLTRKNREIIFRYLDGKGIEFTDYDGVRRKADNQISVLEGTSGFIEFLKDVHQVVPARPDVVVNNVDERLFLHWEGDFNTIHQNRMKEAGASSRIIVEEGDDHLIASEYAEYRWAPKELFSTISYYVYGDRTALIDFQKNNVFVYLIRRQAIADFFRNEFQKVWDLSRVPLE